MHRNSPPAIRLSKMVATALPSARGWSAMVAFASTEDLASPPTTGKQVYLFSLFAYDCQFGTAKPASCPVPPKSPITKVTTGSGKPDDPTVNAGGTIVGFDADGVFGGGSGPGVGHRQIFVKNLVSNALTRVTDAADGDSVNPVMNITGGVVVFESTAGLAGAVAGTKRLFLWTAATNTITKLTDGPGTNVAVNRAASIVAFESSFDLLGDGHDTGVTQIFWWNKKTATVQQLTDGNKSSRNPEVVAGIRRKFAPGTPKVRRPRAPEILFHSAATNLKGTTGMTGTQVYVGPTALGTLPPISALTPIAADGCTPAAPGNSSFATAESHGRKIAFVSTGDLMCNGTTGNRAFVVDLSVYPNKVMQLTGRGDVQGPLNFAIGNFFVAMSTNDDLGGTGVCGHQLNVVDFFTGRWPAATVAGTTPGEPPAGDPVASCNDGNACTTDTCDPNTGCKHTAVPNCP